MIRQAAFINTGSKLLKGGLHCHTTRSDGDCTPEETMKLHAEHGYDFLAITDHRKYNRTNFVPETDILIIPGMEMDGTFERRNGFRCFHSVAIGPDDETNGFADGETLEKRDVADQFEFQQLLDMAHAKNNLTFYCHPEWSSTPTRYFDQLKGNFAMEIWNTGCVIEDQMDDDAAYWDEMLGLGHKIWGVAVDDGHKAYQHCGGWVMVNAEKNVNAILDALKEGRFYSTTGPVIHDFYIEDGVAHVKAQGCADIRFCADKHPTKIFRNVDEASLDLKDSYEYIRAVVTDKDGRQAWTNPIFIK